MGVLTDYFSAPSDAAAAPALDRVGGPSQPTAGPSPLPPFDTFQSKGLDPYVIMGKLEEALTGQDYRVITAGSPYGRMVAKRGAQGPWVAKVSSPLQAALSLAGSDKLARAAAPPRRTSTCTAGSACTRPMPHPAKTPADLRTHLAQLGTAALHHSQAQQANEHPPNRQHYGKKRAEPIQLLPKNDRERIIPP
jgi:hypothetical protein